MKLGSTFFLKGVIFIIGAVVITLCITILYLIIFRGGAGEYFPIIMVMYAAAIPFFIALFQALRLLRLIDKNTAFSELSVKALKRIKYCAISITVLYVVAMPIIFQVADKDDAPGVVAIALVIIFASIVVAAFAAVLQKVLKNAIAIKFENDLTV